MTSGVSPVRQTDGHQSPIRVVKDGDQPTNQVSAALWLDTIFRATGIRVSTSLRLLQLSSAVLHVRICLYNTVIYKHIRLCTYSSYIGPSLGVRIKNECSYMSVYQLSIRTIYVRICAYIRTIYVRIWNDYTATQNHIRTQPYVHVYCSYVSV